jgi:hypothetical protein
MAQTNAKLKVVKIDRHSQTFGNGQQEYAVYQCETSNKEIIPVGVSHNMLTANGIGSALYDAVVGSTLVIKDDVDIRTGEMRSDAFDRIQAVVEKRPKRTILLINNSNAEVIKTEALRDECVDYSIRVDSIVKVEKDRARKLERSRQRAAQLEQELLNSAPTPSSSDEDITTEETPAGSDIVAELEKNDAELPF